MLCTVLNLVTGLCVGTNVFVSPLVFKRNTAANRGHCELSLRISRCALTRHKMQMAAVRMDFDTLNGDFFLLNMYVFYFYFQSLN